MGHIISKEGVNPDPTKIQVVVDWPTPKTIKQLKGFLGLSGYYRRFIRGYAQIATPMTNLLRKDAFSWSEISTKSFEDLKLVMTKAIVLQFSDFGKEFTVEIDVGNLGIGAALLQENHPIAFFSSKISGRLSATLCI